MLFFSLKTPLMRNADRKRPRAPASLKAFSSLLLLNGLFLLPAPWVQPGDSLGAGGSMGDWDCLLPWGEKFLGANLQGVCHIYRPCLRLLLCQPHKAVTTKVTGKAEASIPFPYKGKMTCLMGLGATVSTTTDLLFLSVP